MAKTIFYISVLLVVLSTAATVAVSTSIAEALNDEVSLAVDLSGNPASLLSTGGATASSYPCDDQGAPRYVAYGGAAELETDDSVDPTCRRVRRCYRALDVAGNISGERICQWEWRCCYYGNAGAPKRCW